MKKNITNKVKLSRYFYSLILLLVCVNASYSQGITKQYERVLNVSPDSKIYVKGAGSLPFQSEGSLKVNTVDGYAIEPRDNKGVAAFIANKLDIKTSNDNTVKQLVTVKVIPHEKDKNDAKALLEAIRINILSSSDQYEIDNNLNIERLSFKNGFFKGTQNLVVLDNGKSYNVRGIEISATVVVPHNSTLAVMSKYIDIAIEDFAGALNINADKSVLDLGNVSELNGRFNSCKVNFKHIDKAHLVAYNSTINGNAINFLDLGTEQIVKESLFNSTKKASLSTYTINTVGKLNVLETSNDEFNLGEVGSIDVQTSHFSNYNVKRLQSELSIRAKNGNISIDAISKNVTKLDINNQVSTISLGVQELDDYIISFPNLEYTEKIIPSSAKEISNGDLIAYQKGSGRNKGIISISCKNCKIDIKD